MIQAVRQVLERAAGTGEVIRIAYHGGSQPGSIREITPIAVTDTDLVAHDLASGSRKVFKLARVEIPNSTVSAPTYDPTLSPPPEETRPIKAIFQARLGELEALGWHVQVSENAIGLHRFFKNGKPRKTPDVHLVYEEFTTDLFVELGGQQTEDTRKSKLPYHVRSERVPTRSFARVSSAVAAFWDEARHLAPRGATC